MLINSMLFWPSLPSKKHSYLTPYKEIYANLLYFPSNWSTNKIESRCIFFKSYYTLSILAIKFDILWSNTICMTWSNYRSTRLFTIFFALRYFSLSMLKVVSNRLPLFSFLFPFNSKFGKQGAAVFTPALLFPPMFYPLLRGPIFLDPIPPLLLYIKHLFPFNKQFSSDSFLDWGGLHWDFCSTITSPPASVPLSHPFRRRSTVRAKI